jgi:hypothetical protein
LDSKLKDKRFRTERWQAIAEFNLFLIPPWIPFLFVTVVPKYVRFPHFQRTY